ncbi:hypothetical protein AB9K35_21325 [Leisingera sp. XS_AS12]|uniref:hypothetical protein n=1 Tax=Leisingera sp. XS_AS12 TaxID=3241294 RepID=UPI00351923BC
MKIWLPYAFLDPHKRERQAAAEPDAALCFFQLQYNPYVKIAQKSSSAGTTRNGYRTPYGSDAQQKRAPVGALFHIL